MQNRYMKWSAVNNINEIDITMPVVVLYGTVQPAKMEWFMSFLSENEKTYYRKFHSETPIQCRAMLRLLLSGYLKSAPERIHIQKGVTGKPYVADSRLFFNVSHSGSAYMIAICRTGRVGVDLEKLCGNEDLPAIAGYAFSEQEEQRCFSSGNSGQQFVKIWTLKEALLKATGAGWGSKLSEQDVYEKLNQYKLTYVSFACPQNETASLVIRERTLPKTICHWE